MRLSKLQEYILEKCYNYKRSLPADFYDFYVMPSAAPLQMGHIRIMPPRSGRRAVNLEEVKSRKLIQDAIHKSLDSLVHKDLLSAVGKKTARKWFIHRIKLTKSGKKAVSLMMKNKQRKLPIK